MLHALLLRHHDVFDRDSSDDKRREHHRSHQSNRERGVVEVSELPSNSNSHESILCGRREGSP